MTTVGLAIPSIPPRAELLQRAIASALAQSRPVDAISIAVDHDHAGAAVTRNRSWRNLDVDYIAFLDDDDLLLPHHIETCLRVAEATDADLVRPWHDINTQGAGTIFPDYFRTDPWDPNEPRQTTVTCLWRRDALVKIDGFPEPTDGTDSLGWREGEEFLAVCRLSELGGRIECIEEVTWLWTHWDGNTSGLPRW